MINFRELRRGMIVMSNTLDKLRSSRELALAKTSIQKAMMWSGTYMKFAGLGDNPYAKQDGDRETVADIEPMFDATEETLNKEILDKGLIYTVDQMREYYAKQIESLVSYITNDEVMEEKLKETSPQQIVHTNMCIYTIYTYLTEARLWLGMELGRIREHGEAETTL